MKKPQFSKEQTRLLDAMNSDFADLRSDAKARTEFKAETGRWDAAADRSVEGLSAD